MLWQGVVGSVADSTISEDMSNFNRSGLMASANTVGWRRSVDLSHMMTAKTGSVPMPKEESRSIRPGTAILHFTS